MVTPMRPDGSIDLTRRSAWPRTSSGLGHDGLVVSGTTGESPTTSAEEKDELLRAVVGAVGDRCVVVAGAGSNDTAKERRVGAPGREGRRRRRARGDPVLQQAPAGRLVAHFTAVADASDLPVMVYDIPGRSGIAIARETYLRIAEHPRIAAVKDARGDLWFASEMMQLTGLDCTPATTR